MKKHVFKIAMLTVLVLMALVFLTEPATSQCAMCKASAEANLKAGGGDPQGLNMGILYILALPYLLVLGIGYWWWSNRRKEHQELTDLSEEDFA